MGKLFSDAVINDVLDRSNIVDVVTSYLPLKRVGRSYKACCPFHPEKTPSFIVSSEKQIFHCFGCGVGGNALTFVMQYEKLNFREALEALAQRSGVPLPEPDKSDFERSKDDLSKNLYSLYAKAAQFYHNNLMKSAEAKAARAYLQSRGIPKETAQKFKLGYAPQGWDTLIEHLKGQGVNLSLIEKSGLVVSKENGGYYDRFRNRILFPIIDLKDRTVAFGARVLDQSLPKYINSPETPIYTKGKHLFGLSVAKDAIREKDKVIVVEGYLDMIVPFEAGIKNIVASLGTALTFDQIRLIKRTTSQVVMLYDADLAGEHATLRALDLLIKEDMFVRIACLPKNNDPDSFVRKSGAEAFAKMIADAKPIFDYKLDLLLLKFDAGTTTGKDKIVREMLPTVKKFKNQVTIFEYTKKLAERLKLDEKALRDDLHQVEDSETREVTQEFESAALKNFKLTEIPITERMLVKLMLEEIHLVDQLRTLIEPSDFMEEKLRKIVQFIFDFFSQGKTCKPHEMMTYLGDEEAINLISELATLEIHDCPNKEKLISDCVRRLKRDKILYRCQQLHKEIETAQAQGDHQTIDRLLSEYNSLIKQRSLFHGDACSQKKPR
jgi:DNA primase